MIAMDGSIQKYLAFVRTVECGSFTKAAETLGYAQSSVSKMIADLEAEWGLELLERSRSGVQLTADGLSMLSYARDILESCERAREQASALRGVTSGLIRIGTFSSVATHWMPRIIKALQRDHPNIEYELLLGDYREIEQWILEGRVECGFLRLPTRPGLDSISLEKDELVVVLPKAHPLTEQERIRPQDLNGQPFMLLEHGGKTEVSELLERYDIRPLVRFTSWDDYAILSMVENGFGIGILPRLILKRIPYDVEVRSLSVEAYRELGFALRSRKTASSVVKCFVQYLPFRSEEMDC